MVQDRRLPAWPEKVSVESRPRYDPTTAPPLLGNAQKRDERFYPKDSVIIFNQKVRKAEPGTKGKLAGIVKTGVLAEFNGVFVTVANRFLDRITVCQTCELPLASGDRLHLKANRKLAAGRRVTNGELVTVKSVRADDGVELTDGRVLDKFSVNFCLVTPSRPMVRKARRWITSCSPTRPSRQRRTRNNGM